MPGKKYDVELSTAEREELESFISTGLRRAQAILRARILLKVDDGGTDAEISKWLDCSEMTVYRTRKRYNEDGISAINRATPDRGYDRKLEGDAQERLVELVRSDPPGDRSRWTLRLLANELVAKDGVDIESVSPETVRTTLAQTNCSIDERNNE